MSMYCITCGREINSRTAIKHMEKCFNKVSMTSTFGAATATNPRPFKCVDCKSAFRIHGHLAKHLRSKMHIMKLECLRKLPFGTYAEIERSSINLNDIDTTDCDTSLASLQIMAQKVCSKDIGKLKQWEIGMLTHNVPSSGETSSDEEEAKSVRSISQRSEVCRSRNYFIKMCRKLGDADLMKLHMQELKNESIYKCQLCPISLRNLNELRTHYLLEHNVESSKIEFAHTSVSQERKIEEKENTHNVKKVEKCAIKKLQSGQRIDAI